MNNVIVPIGAGLIISVAGYIYSQRSKSVERWLNQRRVPAWDEESRYCPSCGKQMKPATTQKDNRKVWFCKNWKTCETYVDHVTGEVIPSAKIRT